MSAQQPEPTTAEPEIPYEAARDELVSIVTRLESGGISLAETMTLWERGEKLADICQTWLDGARTRIEAARSQAEDSQD
ncbi:exodeoxyribonuclease VII small subunit [Cutibacterium equinum]|uniref:Exodeoxyribonuclease 7 small subunit n=1 Tax=Cutibacterium equinum TaxID=3016342 RepID=A0ABY7R0U7_9ACTN|nr:exodeoxyribonuclease VII small subunit [Cutibacterium equinum]WCC80419.1 exodeoxyribonuclease VII small subunit [Cutibacterium equinum]